MDRRSSKPDHHVQAWMEQNSIQTRGSDHFCRQRRKKRRENHAPPQGRVSEWQGNCDGSRRGLRGVAPAKGVSGMRNHLLGLTLAAVAALASSPSILAQTRATNVPKAKTPSAPADLSGVWRRSRRAPDKARKYTIYELAFSISNERPPMTPWAEENFKAKKPNVGPNAVTLAETNDPIANCFPPGVPRIYLIRGEPVEILQTPGKVIMLYEYDHFVREIYTDGRQPPKDTY